MTRTKLIEGSIRNTTSGMLQAHASERLNKFDVTSSQTMQEPRRLCKVIGLTWEWSVSYNLKVVSNCVTNLTSYLEKFLVQRQRTKTEEIQPL